MPLVVGCHWWRDLKSRGGGGATGDGTHATFIYIYICHICHRWCDMFLIFNALFIVHFHFVFFHFHFSFSMLSAADLSLRLFSNFNNPLQWK